MSFTTDSPFGLQVSGTFGAASYNGAIKKFRADPTKSFFAGDPVTISNEGLLVPALAGTAAGYQAPIGVFVQCKYSSANFQVGQVDVSNHFIANSPLLANTPLFGFVETCPLTVYRIQANGAMALTNIGNNFNWAAPAGGGNTVSGMSKYVLDFSAGPVNNTVASNLKVLGFWEVSGNEKIYTTPADVPYPVVEVMINDHFVKAGTLGS